MKTKTVFSILPAALAGMFIYACAQTVSFKTVSPQEFQKLSTAKNTIILDVRTAEEVSEGKIPNAINIDFYSSTFEQEISKIDKSKTILVYCRSGRRSAGAAEVLSKKGYKVINLDGGITNWQAQGFPVEK